MPKKVSPFAKRSTQVLSIDDLVADFSWRIKFIRVECVIIEHQVGSKLPSTTSVRKSVRVQSKVFAKQSRGGDRVKGQTLILKTQICFREKYWFFHCFSSAAFNHFHWNYSQTNCKSSRWVGARRAHFHNKLKSTNDTLHAARWTFLIICNLLPPRP